MRKFVLLILIAAVLFSCEKEKDDFKLKFFIIASQKGFYTSWNGARVPSILVTENPNEQFVPLGQDIEGFNYVEGFEYKLEVKEYTLKDPPQDGSNKRYVLKRIISKQ